MIQVEFSDECIELMGQLEIPRARVIEAINIRDVWLTDDGITHMVAVRWPKKGKLTLVHARITERQQEGTVVNVMAVQAQLAIELTPELPAGSLNRGMEAEEILNLVAASFGRRVSCSPAGKFAHLYAGPWDGNLPPRFEGEPGELFFTGSFSPESKSCELVWAFDVESYRRWFREEPNREKTDGRGTGGPGTPSEP